MPPNNIYIYIEIMQTNNNTSKGPFSSGRLLSLGPSKRRDVEKEKRNAKREKMKREAACSLQTHPTFPRSNRKGAIKMSD